MNTTLTGHLLYNVDKLKNIFHYPQSKALYIRSVYLSFLKREAVVFFVEGAAEIKTIESRILTPFLSEPVQTMDDDDIIDFLIEEILTSSICKKITTFDAAVNELINGNTVIFIEDERAAISVVTDAFKDRQITEPSTEFVIKGPKESFNESMSTNCSLIRKRIKDPNLISELLTVGDREPQQVTVMYIKDVADDGLVKQVKQRVNQIEIDVVIDLTILEHLIEKRPYSLIPSTLTTERPDRTVSFLREGHVVLLMEGSPLALIVPITFWSLIHTAEDQYLRWASGNFTRVIRLIALVITLLVPSVYLAVTTFHPEMFPTDLMLAIAASRERIPIPAFWELLFMEITLEILREAGIRIPTVIGPTIGIVGTIILGQAAVEANIVSPILVIVVSITGLASFAIPDIGFNIAVRITRFIFLISAAAMGFLGLSLAFIVFLAYAASYSSFGVPFFAPLAPSLPSSNDLYMRPPVQKQSLRPFHLFPKDKQRMKNRKERNK